VRATLTAWQMLAPRETGRHEKFQIQPCGKIRSKSVRNGVLGNIGNVTLVALGIAIALGLIPSSALAGNFALLCIDNSTDVKINYQLKWGDGPWKNFTLEAGERYRHTWRYEREGEDRSPICSLRFDADLSSDTYWKRYRLKPYASPNKTDCERYGKMYYFRYSGGENSMDLVEKD
jgi:hypothetical protein